MFPTCDYFMFMEDDFGKHKQNNHTHADSHISTSIPRFDTWSSCRSFSETIWGHAVDLFIALYPQPQIRPTTNRCSSCLRFESTVLCERMMEALSHAITKSNHYSPDWSALRVSFGLNGMVVPCKDLPVRSSIEDLFSFGLFAVTYWCCDQLSFGLFAVIYWCCDLLVLWSIGAVIYYRLVSLL